MREINKIILHCSASRCDKDFDVNDIKEWHLQRGFTDVGYHYIIKLNGEIQWSKLELEKLSKLLQNYL